MNHYPHHIGDYRRDTGHLSLLEHGIYHQLLDTYYLSEAPIPKETELVFRRLRADTEVEQKAVMTVLREFFEDTQEGWVHRRCEVEIAKYRARAAQAKANGIKGGRPSKPVKTDPVSSGLRKGTEPKANQEPVTKNQEGTSPRRGADPVKDEIWTSGRTLLEGEGKSRESAGSFLGKLCKDFGQVLVLDAVRDCVKATPAKPSEWLVARCQERRANAGNKQVGLEKRNRHAVSGWKPPELREPKHAAG